MAKILVLNDNTNLIANNINDVIAIYRDDQELGKKEQEQVDSGLFKLIITEKTVDDLNLEMQVEKPQVKEMWYDISTLEWKELSKRPKASFQYIDGFFKHNYTVSTDNLTVCNQKIKTELESVKSELESVKTELVELNIKGK